MFQFRSIKISHFFALLLAGSLGCGGPAETPATDTTRSAAGTRPNFSLPLPCGQTWQASTYSGHWPDQDSIDLGLWSGGENISSEVPVLASASGSVLQVFDANVVVSPPHGNALYIDHGDGWVTHYLHLTDLPDFAVGDFIVKGQQIGTVGNTGTEAMHLHYTQLADGSAVPIVFDNAAIATQAADMSTWNTWGNGEELTAGDIDADGLCNTIDLCNSSPDNNDLDGDGIGDACDECPSDFDQPGAPDADGDGIPDACDTCPGIADASNLDTDSDGQGDVCDTNDDNDSCPDATDMNDTSAEHRIGSILHVNCHPSSTIQYGSESGDTDGDGIKDCADDDDDNDMIKDAVDGCPVDATGTCFTNGPSCPFTPIFFTCRTGDCNGQILRVEQVINPDPTTRMNFDIVSIGRDEIVLAPLRGFTVAESLEALRGGMRLASGRLPGGALQMAVVTGRGVVVSDIASYAPASLRVTNMVGRNLVVKLGVGGVEALAR